MAETAHGHEDNEPEWLTLARDTVLAVAFQRATRQVHAVGKDGRTRMGCVDLLGCYAVDEMEKKWAAYLGMEKLTVPVPTEAEAMQLMAQGKGWREWIAAQTESTVPPVPEGKLL